MKKKLNEGNQIHNFISSSGTGTVINYGSGSNFDFLTSYGSGSGSDFITSYGSGSGSTSQKVTVLLFRFRFRFHNAVYMSIFLDDDILHCILWVLLSYAICQRFYNDPHKTVLQYPGYNLNIFTSFISEQYRKVSTKWGLYSQYRSFPVGYPYRKAVISAD